MNGEAIFSKDLKYRYVLKRSLGSLLRWYHPILFIMLNPSTADAYKDDPTIKQCIKFGKKEGYTHLIVVNLFALRSTDPKLLAAAADPIGPENDKYIEEQVLACRHGLIVAAWGSHKFAQVRAKEITLKFGPFVCLGTTKDGSPWHPLRKKIQSWKEYRGSYERIKTTR